MSVIYDKIPAGPEKDKWSAHKAHIGVVSPANKKKLDVIIVGTGLAGGSAAASLAELGYNVTAFCYQDSPRRAHSIAAQGGINADKNYPTENAHTLSPHRAVTPPPKTTPTITTLYSVCSTKPSKAVTIVPGKPMYIVWQK